MAFEDSSIYRIKSKAFDGYTLNVYGTNAASTGRNVCLYPDTPSDIMQKWVLRFYDLDEGTVRLHSAVNNNFVLDRSDGSLSNSCNNNAHLCSTSSTSERDSELYLDALGNGVFRIGLVNRIGGKALFLTAANSPGSALPVSSIPNGTLTSARGNVYWAESIVDSNASSKQKWFIEGPGIDTGSTVPIPTGAQKLIYPMEYNYHTAGYKSDSPAYSVCYTYGTHYAIDLVPGSTSAERIKIKASGTGTVIGYKTFRSLGKVLAVQYDNVINRNGQNIGSVTALYCHVDNIQVSSGTVEKGQWIADRGATGLGAKDENGNDVPHLHLEFTEQTFNNAASISTPSENSGADSTINPLDILYRGSAQTVHPDTAIGRSAYYTVNGVSYLWYNIEKINSTPTE